MSVLSGSQGTTFATGYRIQIEWSATQNIADNSSTISASLYLISLGSSYSINSSSSRSGSIVIDGTSYPFSGVTASLSGNQKKLLYTASKTVTHNSSGEKSFAIGGDFSLSGITLGGTAQGTVWTGTGNFTLKPIPRASTISTANIGFTVPDYLGIGITRHSSSFTHTAKLSVGGTLIKTITGITTATTFAWTVADVTAILQRINANDKISATVSISLETYSGTTLIGTTTKTGTVYSMTATRFGLDKYTFPVTNGTTLTVNMEKYAPNDNVTQTTVITLGTFTKTLTSVNNVTFSPTTAEITTMQGQMTGTIRQGTVTVTSYYNGVQVRDPISAQLSFSLENQSPPTFTASQFSYADTNTTTSGITGNNQVIIQGRSTLSVTLSSPATASSGATISNYVITVDGRSQTVTTTGTYSFGTISSGSNVTITIRAVDSRGNSTTASKTVTVIPYFTPWAIGRGNRNGSFGDLTTISISGSLNMLPVGGSNKNTITSIRYRYKARTSTTYSTWTTRTPTVSNGLFTSGNFTLTLSSANAWDFQVEVSDRIATVTSSFVVSAGKPIFFIDSGLNSVGVNQLPTTPESFEVTGATKLTGTLETIGRASIGSPTVSTGALLVRGTNNHMTIEESDLGNTWLLRVASGTLHMTPNVGTGSTKRVEIGSNLTVTNNLTVQGTGSVSGSLSAGSLTTSGQLTAGSIRVHGEIIGTVNETGFCGIGALKPASSGTVNVIGYAVQFKTTKSFTPSEIVFTNDNTANALQKYGIDIRPDGFWFYISSSTASQAFSYWRGTYTTRT